jgi:hypothetical protein
MVVKIVCASRRQDILVGCFFDLMGEAVRIEQFRKIAKIVRCCLVFRMRTSVEIKFPMVKLTCGRESSRVSAEDTC